MSKVITLEEAQANLLELINCLQPGVEIIITRDDQPIAELHLPTSAAALPRFGNCRGALTILAEDDEHLQNFKDYLP